MVGSGRPAPRRRAEGEDGADRASFRRFAVAGALAVVLHAVVLGPAGWLLPEPPQIKPRESLAVTLLERHPLLAPLLYHPNDPIPEGQVVDAPGGPTVKDEEPPPDARFLSERARHAEHETQAAVRVAGPHRVGPAVSGPGRRGAGPSAGAFGPRCRGVGAGRRPAPAGRVIAVATPASPPPGPAAATPEGPRASGEGAAGEPAPQAARSPLTDGARGDSPVPPGDSLAPTVDILAEVVGGTGLDHLEDVERGDVTALSTRPYAHAGFFRRVQERVRQFWDVPGAFALHDPEGTIYGFRDRETVVLITLDCDGNLVADVLLEESGARFLDEEATSAIEEAAPFHNPPRGLCDERRNIITFTFGFYVETDEGPTLRVRLR